MQRYFGRIVDKHVILEEDDIFHITKVMRCKIGDKIEVVSDGRLYEAEIKGIKPVVIDVVGLIKEDHELPNQIILICALLKGDKLDYVIQKATELGVSEIVFALTHRTIVKVRKLDKDFKFERYRRIAKEASEQSKRLRIPTINRIVTLDRIKEVKADIKLVAYENVSGTTKSFLEGIKSLEKGKKLAILIGPEGGFENDEIAFLEDLGYKCVSLGKRILRAETASIYALSVIGSYLERK